MLFLSRSDVTFFSPSWRPAKPSLLLETAEPICCTVASSIFNAVCGIARYGALLSDSCKLICQVALSSNPCLFAVDCPTTYPLLLTVCVDNIGRTRRIDSWPRLWCNGTVTFQPSHGRTWVRPICYGYPWIRAHFLSSFVICYWGTTLSGLTCQKGFLCLGDP